MRPPVRNEPLESAAICIDWVKPHGRKKVPTPIMMGVKVLCSIFLNIWKMPAGRVILLWRKIPTRSAPRSIMTSAANRPSMLVKSGLISTVCQRAPRSHPRKPNQRILAAWKRTIFLVSFTLSWEAFAVSERTRPPTRARQLDTEAMRPMIKLVTGVTQLPMPKLSMPDFWRMENMPRNMSPIGIACQITQFFWSPIIFSSESL